MSNGRAVQVGFGCERSGSVRFGSHGELRTGGDRWGKVALGSLGPARFGRERLCLVRFDKAVLMGSGVYWFFPVRLGKAV